MANSSSVYDADASTFSLISNVVSTKVSMGKFLKAIVAHLFVSHVNIFVYDALANTYFVSRIMMMPIM